METLWNKPQNKFTDSKATKAITITTREKIFNESEWLSHVRFELASMPGLKSAIRRIEVVPEPHQDGSYHGHGFIEIQDPIKLFKDFGKNLSLKKQIDNKIGFCDIKSADANWINYCYKNIQNRQARQAIPRIPRQHRQYLS